MAKLKLNWLNAESSNLDSIAYDVDNKTMYIKFYSGKTYKYSPITENGWREFLNSRSRGSYFAHHIKSNPTITCEEVME